MEGWNEGGDPAEPPFERVYVELDWYDGPRSGIADVAGVPHYFEALNAYGQDNGDDDIYWIWPATVDQLRGELAQWRTFVEWNDRFERGEAFVDSHPAHGGIDEGYDDLTRALEPGRKPPSDARTAHASWRSHGGGKRYAYSGPGYSVRWAIVTRSEAQ